MILISACLAGVNCKYSGDNNYNEKVANLLKRGDAILVCPEQMGGLPTPRIGAEIKVIDCKRYVFMKDGTDVTNQFEKGAKETLEIAKKVNATKAILKSRSPSCGVGIIYDGTFSHRLVKGDGITCQLLQNHGIIVYSEDEIEDFLKFIEKRL